MTLSGDVLSDQGAEEELIYVSWGGTGRGAALRMAYERAADEGKGLAYLAILDPPHFKDLDNKLLGLVTEELEWLLEAHVRVVSGASYQTIPCRVIVRTGEVDDEVQALVQKTGATTVLIGAPVPTTGHASVADLISALQARTGVEVGLVQPELPNV